MNAYAVLLKSQLMPQPLQFTVARSTILDAIRSVRILPKMEFVDLADADGRVLAAPVNADRDYPPLDRSMRDGFAIRAADAPGSLTVIGEVRAGELFDGEVKAGQAVEIMTGAPVPRGADAVVMVEHVRVEGDHVSIDHGLSPGMNVSPRGCDALEGGEILHAGQRIGFPEVAVLATIGMWIVPVYMRPLVAILTTGDEILEMGTQPLPHQIRDSNAWSLATQVRRAGGEPIVLPPAPDSVKKTAELVGRGLKTDLLLISGGVSAGKYDLVEGVLAKYGGEFYFDRVLVQPGQPLVFGRAQGTFVFGLPGNPASTMVCFEVFARAAVELLGGQNNPILPLTEAVLSTEFHHRPGLTRFLPAAVSADGCHGNSGAVVGLGRRDGACAGQRVSRGRAGQARITPPESAFACWCDDGGRLTAMKKLSHFDEAGQARMVDVSAKTETRRTATARAFVRMSRATLKALPDNPKGNPLEVARIAGIQAAKKTSELIPMCHPLMLTHADVKVTVKRDGVLIEATAATTAQTGVEMEALTAASVAALTVYDMTKALDKGITIESIELVKKSGGKSGTWRRTG